VQRNQALAKKSGEFLIGDDLRVTRLGFGAMRSQEMEFGMRLQIALRPSSFAARCRIGNHFTTQRDSYGPGVSEEIIAEALHPYPTGLVIASKGGFVRPGPNQWVENGKPEP